MGLDQTLSVSLYITDDVAKQVKDACGLPAEVAPYGMYVRASVLDWRKANQIHKWFVTECQDGVDDCREVLVSRESLETLVALLDEVLDNPDKASELLPSEAGFFFGGTEYDTWYFDQVRDSLRDLKAILAEPAYATADFQYSSSW